MTRFVVVLPLAPLAVGSRFAVASWPLHITVLAPFLTDVRASLVADALAPVAGAVKPFPVLADRDALFGRRADIPVTLIAPSDTLSALHSTLVAALRPFASHPDEDAFTGPSFTPHVTAKGSSRVAPGAVLNLTQLALVDMVPRSSPSGRTVLAVCPLG